MMWFGTWDGLNAYNGYGFRTYKFAPDNANTISNNVIRNIVEEAKGILWVATDYGINRIDVENDRIERFYPGYEDNGPTAEQVFSVAAAADGTIFCAATGWGHRLLRQGAGPAFGTQCPAVQLFGDTCRLLRRAEYPAAAYRTGGAGSDSLRAVRERGAWRCREKVGLFPKAGSSRCSTAGRRSTWLRRCGNLPLRTP